MSMAARSAKVIARYATGNKPRDVEALIAEAPNARLREQLELTFRGSAMDLIDRFFPDEVRHRPLRAQLAFAAVQSTYNGRLRKLIFVDHQQPIIRRTVTSMLAGDVFHHADAVPKWVRFLTKMFENDFDRLARALEQPV